MTQRLLVDGDSIAKSPTSGRLSIGRLDSALGFLQREISDARIRTTLVVSYQFSQAMSTTQRARLERLLTGTFQTLPAGIHLRDFIVRGADDGSAIIISNSAFTRQRDYFPWLTTTGGGRHILARRLDDHGAWEFVEARPANSARRTLREIIAPGQVNLRDSPTQKEVVQPDNSEIGGASPPESAIEMVSDSLGTDRAPLPAGPNRQQSPPPADSDGAATNSEVLPRTSLDLCALFGVNGDYVLALVNRGQGPPIERLDQVLEARTRARVERLLTYDINRYQRNIYDLPKLRKTTNEEVRRRARNAHIPLALRPGGDRTSNEGFVKLLERFSAKSFDIPTTLSVSALAKRFDVDVRYVIDLASMHSGDRTFATSTLPTDLAEHLEQLLESDLFPLTHSLSTAAGHLGIGLDDAKSFADGLSVGTAPRPNDWRLSASDYHRLMIEAWPMRLRKATWEPPSNASEPGSPQPRGQSGLAQAVGHRPATPPTARTRGMLWKTKDARTRRLNERRPKT